MFKYNAEYCSEADDIHRFSKHQAYDFGRSITPFITVKTAVFAPMPSPSEVIAAIATTGVLRSARRAYRKSSKTSVITYLPSTLR